MIEQLKSEMVLSLVGSLLAVIGLIILLAFIAKKIKPLSNIVSSRIKIISKQTLAYKNQIVIIEIDKEQYIVGLNSHSISNIGKIK